MAQENAPQIAGRFYFTDSNLFHFYIKSALFVNFANNKNLSFRTALREESHHVDWRVNKHCGGRSG
jgi:hypothetical protein